MHSLQRGVLCCFMLRAKIESLGATFYDKSPTLTRAQVVERHSAWWRGERVPSEVTAVGFIALRESEKDALRCNFIWSQRYTPLGPGDYLFDRLSRVTQVFDAITDYDAGAEPGAQRGDFYEGEHSRQVLGGYYRQDVDGQPWHSDDPMQPQVRYAVTHGEAPIRGTRGSLSRDSIVQTDDWGEGLAAPGEPESGDLIDQNLVAPGGQLELLDLPTGTVVRFTTDVHAGGVGNGPRMLHRVTYAMPPIA